MRYRLSIVQPPLVLRRESSRRRRSRPQQARQRTRVRTPCRNRDNQEPLPAPRVTKRAEHPLAHAPQGPRRHHTVYGPEDLRPNRGALPPATQIMLAQELHPSRRLKRHVRDDLRGYLSRHSPHYRRHHGDAASGIRLPWFPTMLSLARTRNLAYVGYWSRAHPLRITR